MEEEENDLFWHALNYRTASTDQAHDMWLELEACKNRLILAEREACAKECDNFMKLPSPYAMHPDDCAKAIRNRSN